MNMDNTNQSKGQGKVYFKPRQGESWEDFTVRVFRTMYSMQREQAEQEE